MYRLHDCLILMRAGYGEDFGESCPDDVGFISHATRHNNAAIFSDGFANGFKAFFLCTIQKAAGVNQNNICAGIICR